jgi:predicted amidophosphoribosyltransferase
LFSFEPVCCVCGDDAQHQHRCWNCSADTLSEWAMLP